jgi:hypothetical protein
MSAVEWVLLGASDLVAAVAIGVWLRRRFS